MEKIAITTISIEDFEKSMSKLLSEHLKKIAFNEPEKEDELLTRKQTAEMLKVDISTIHNWINNKKLKPIKLGSKTLFSKKDITKFIESSKIK